LPCPQRGGRADNKTRRYDVPQAPGREKNISHPESGHRFPRPPLPYMILAGVMAIIASFAFAFAALMTSGDPLRHYNIFTGVVMLVLAILLWFPARHSRGDWALDVAVVIGIAVAGGGTFLLANDTGLVTVGFGLILFAVFAAYFRPYDRFLAELVLMLSVYLFCLLANPAYLRPIYFLLVAIVVTTVSMMVALMARQLRELALQDTLTGLLNRRGLDLMAEQIRASAQRSGAPVTVGILDLDDFKALNDTEGHSVGDQRLIDVADDWRTSVRRGDIVARFGGDEFVVVLAGVEPEEARQLAARVAVRRPGAWSIGFAHWDPSEDLYVAVHRADEALYERKRAR